VHPVPAALRDEHVAAVARAYDLGTVLDFSGPTARGQMGQVFSVITDRGRWAVKHLLRPQVESDVRDDLGFVQAARRAGVSTPAIICTGDGSVLLDLGGAQVRVYEWVDLAEPDMGLDPAAVGGAVGRLHACDFRGTHGPHPWYSEPVGAPRWDELVSELTAAGAPFAADLAALRDEIVALEGLLAPMTNPITCHRDLFADNLRGTVDRRVCVIDWDNQGLADPGQEIAFVLAEFASGAPGRARALVAGYLSAGGPGRVRRPGDFSMLIATLGHINERACARWLAHPPGDPERARMADLFAEFSSNPLTRASIDQLLDAVADLA
jgi:Ser/Thr protein kinase RdoA (MazF antagonist)